MSLEEEGEPLKALAVAEAFERRAPAWTANAPYGVRLHALYARHHAGRIRDAEFKEGRERLEREATKREKPYLDVGLAILMRARFAETPDEVSDALSRIGKPPEHYVLGRSADVQAFLGRLYLLAGRTDEAVSTLGRAASTCSVLPDIDVALVGHHFGLNGLGEPIQYMRTHLWLGQALEAKGNKAGACKAYGVILDRWKNPKPRSVTVEKAKERVKALDCGKD